MKHKDGLDIAAVLLLLLVAVAAMVVPVALTQPQLLAVPAMLVLIALAWCSTSAAACAPFWLNSLCSTDFENSRIQYSLANLPIATVLINDGRILWYNQYFKEQVLGDYDAVTRPVARVLPEFDLAVLLPPPWAGSDRGERRFTAYSATAKGQPWSQPFVPYQRYASIKKHSMSTTPAARRVSSSSSTAMMSCSMI